MKRLVIVGVGSPFGDDTLGWQLLDALAARDLTIPGWDITLSKADRPGPGLLERIKGQDAAVIIDAMQSDEKPGRLRLVELSELERLDSPLSGHEMGVAAALALGRTLEMIPDRVYVLGMEMGEGLRGKVVDEAVGMVKRLFER